MPTPHPSLPPTTAPHLWPTPGPSSTPTRPVSPTSQRLRARWPTAQSRAIALTPATRPRTVSTTTVVVISAPTRDRHRMRAIWQRTCGTLATARMAWRHTWVERTASSPTIRPRWPWWAASTQGEITHSLWCSDAILKKTSHVELYPWSPFWASRGPPFWFPCFNVRSQHFEAAKANEAASLHVDPESKPWTPFWKGAILKGWHCRCLSTWRTVRALSS